MQNRAMIYGYARVSTNGQIWPSSSPRRLRAAASVIYDAVYPGPKRAPVSFEQARLETAHYGQAVEAALLARPVLPSRMRSNLPTAFCTTHTSASGHLDRQINVDRVHCRFAQSSQSVDLAIIVETLPVRTPAAPP